MVTTLRLEMGAGIQPLKPPPPGRINSSAATSSEPNAPPATDQHRRSARQTQAPRPLVGPPHNHAQHLALLVFGQRHRYAVAGADFLVGPLTLDLVGHR